MMNKLLKNSKTIKTFQKNVKCDTFFVYLQP